MRRLVAGGAVAAGVVGGGIDPLGDRLGHGVLLERADIVAAREGRHVEALGQLGAPEGELVVGLAVPAGDIHVVRDGHDGLVADLGGLELAVVDPFVHLAAEAHLDGVVLAGVQPHVAHGEPVVGKLHLPAVHDLLAEDAEFVADGEARHRITQFGGGVHIAGREAAEAAVAETGVRLHGAETVEAEAQPLQNMPDGVEEPQIVEIVAKRRADQELHGHVVDLLALLLTNLFLECPAFFLQKLPHGGAHHAVGLLLGRVLHGAAEHPQAGLVEQFQNCILCHSD